MTTPPTLGTEAPVEEQVASSEATDTLIHTDDETSTAPLPASDRSPAAAPTNGDAAPEPEPGNEPEGQEPVFDDNGQPTNNAAWRQQWNSRESALQTQLTDIRTGQTAAEERAALAESRTEEGELANQVISQRDTRREQLIDGGMDETSALDTANAEARSLVDNYVANRQGSQQSARVTELESENARLWQVGSVNHLMTEYGVPATHRTLLEATTTATQAVDLATALGEAEKNRVEIERLTQAQVPADGETQQVDSGNGDGSMTDDQIIAAGGNAGGTFTDLNALDAAMRRKGIHPDQL